MLKYGKNLRNPIYRSISITQNRATLITNAGWRFWDMFVIPVTWLKRKSQTSSPDFRSSSAPCNTWTRIDPRAKVWNWIQRVKETELKQRAHADTCCRTESMSFLEEMRLEWFFWQTRSDASSMNTHLELQAQQKIRRAPGTLAGGTLKVKNSDHSVHLLNNTHELKDHSCQTWMTNIQFVPRTVC